MVHIHTDEAMQTLDTIIGLVYMFVCNCMVVN
jgi:hypothetical protein